MPMEWGGSQHFSRVRHNGWKFRVFVEVRRCLAQQGFEPYDWDNYWELLL